MQPINFLNHLFAVGPSMSFISLGRRYFSEKDIAPNHIIEFRRGIFQAVHLGGTQSLTLNVDTTTAIFWNSSLVTLLDVAKVVLKLEPHMFGNLDPSQRNRLSKALRGLKFYVQHRNRPDDQRRRYTISRLSLANSLDRKFLMQNEGPPVEVSVRDYMKKTYNIDLRFPRAPLVIVGRDTEFPLELCYMVKVFRPLIPY
jgi:hypothetical protein